MAADPLLAPEREPQTPPPTREKKKLVRRTDKDVSQRLRLGFQLAFLALNVWIGVQFYLWVRYMETNGATRAVARPDGVDGWLPIAALMNLKVWLLTGYIPKVHPSGMFLLLAFLLMSLLLKKAFCSWLCPVGTVSELLWKFGRKLFRRNFDLPKWLDIPLRGLKYLLFGFFGWAIVRMSNEAIKSFMMAPFGVIADVKLLNFFRFLGTTGLIVTLVIVVLSIFIKNFWCRYLCPYGALLGLAALASPARIRRDADACIDCAKCTKACPSRLPVDVKPQIWSAECSMCMNCVAVCPAKGALEVKVTPSRRLPAWAVATGIAAIFFAVVGAAMATGHWRTELPFDVYQTLVTWANRTGHPM